VTGVSTPQPWADVLYANLKSADIRQAFYVPDNGHRRLIEMLSADPSVQTTVLTTEEEGVAMSAGAWLGGQRSVLLMQSSGVGNCINMLSLTVMCHFPLLAVVTMRGEWEEFNPWQIPMGRTVSQALDLMGVRTLRVETLADLDEAIKSAVTLAFVSEQRLALVLAQRLLGRKQWVSQ
jgi:sulfopyruvate decarboxylase alpha subunit